MSQTLAAFIAIVVGGVLIVGVAVVYLMIQDRVLDWWWGRKHPPEPPEESLRRLRSPDWELVVNELADAVPQRLREWYESGNVERECLEYDRRAEAEEDEYFISEFLPLDEKAFALRWDGNDEGCVPIASDIMGNVYYLKRLTGPDWPVYFFYHDGGEDELVADSLEEFLTNLRPQSSGDV